MKIDVTFLGTGTSQGVPLPNCPCRVCTSPDYRDKRLRPSVLIKVNGLTILIDTGPDLRLQLIQYKITSIDAVLLTHYHMDHIGGLDEIRAINFLTKKRIPIYASQETCEKIKTIYYYCFEETKYPGVPDIELITFNNSRFSINGVEIIPILVYHYMLPVFGFRIGNFTYITDAKFVPLEEIEKVRGTSVLVVNALMKKEHISHFTFYEALNFIREVKPGKAYLTHISHRFGRHVDILRECPPNVEPAYDGLSIKI